MDDEVTHAHCMKVVLDFFFFECTLKCEVRPKQGNVREHLGFFSECFSDGQSTWTRFVIETRVTTATSAANFPFSLNEDRRLCDSSVEDGKKKMWRQAVEYHTSANKCRNGRWKKKKMNCESVQWSWSDIRREMLPCWRFTWMTLSLLKKISPFKPLFFHLKQCSQCFGLFKVRGSRLTWLGETVNSNNKKKKQVFALQRQSGPSPSLRPP